MVSKKLRFDLVTEYHAEFLDDDSLIQFGFYFSGNPFVAYNGNLLTIKEIHDLLPEVQYVSSLFAIVKILIYRYNAKD